METEEDEKKEIEDSVYNFLTKNNIWALENIIPSFFIAILISLPIEIYFNIDGLPAHALNLFLFLVVLNLYLFLKYLLQNSRAMISFFYAIVYSVDRILAFLAGILIIAGLVYFLIDIKIAISLLLIMWIITHLRLLIKSGFRITLLRFILNILIPVILIVVITFLFNV